MTPFQAAPNAYSSYGIHPCENGARFLLPQENFSAAMEYQAYYCDQKKKETIQKKTTVKKTVLKLKKDYVEELKKRSEKEELHREVSGLETILFELSWRIRGPEAIAGRNFRPIASGPCILRQISWQSFK